MKDPFYAGNHYGHETYHIDVVSRLHAVKCFDADQCRAALELPNLQKTVRQAVERRLRKLEKQGAS